MGEAGMRTIEATSDIEKIKRGCVLTIGNFDGVHIGHLAILVAAGQAATRKAAELVVMTFEPHPLAVLQPQIFPGVLTPLALKRHLLAEFGVDCLFVLRTGPEFLRLSPADFVERFLVEKIQPGVVIEGESFNFGFGRTGGIHTLRNFRAEKGFEVVVIETKEVKLSIGQAVKVSSTLIRNLLESGKVADAAVALGRGYRLIGKVIPGRGKGGQLGFATANLEPARQIVPAEGVYAGFVGIGGSEEEVCAVKGKIPAAISIGRAETFGSDNPLSIEAHIITEDVGDLHNRWLAMDFVKRIRNQIKFDNESQLSAQIAEDCKKAKEILAIKKE